MSRLEEALEAMDLKPGQTVRCWVKGHEVEVRMLTLDETVLAPDNELYVHIPSPPGRIVRAKPGPPRLPDPIDLEDLAPE